MDQKKTRGEEKKKGKECCLPRLQKSLPFVYTGLLAQRNLWKGRGEGGGGEKRREEKAMKIALFTSRGRFVGGGGEGKGPKRKLGKGILKFTSFIKR